MHAAHRLHSDCNSPTKLSNHAGISDGASPLMSGVSVGRSRSSQECPVDELDPLVLGDEASFPGSDTQPLRRKRREVRQHPAVSFPRRCSPRNDQYL